MSAFDPKRTLTRVRYRLVRKRINIHNDYELRYWSNKFGVTPSELRRAARAVVKKAFPLVVVTVVDTKQGITEIIKP
jgi:hypothetical protein